jgi:adenylate cyclase
MSENGTGARGQRQRIAAILAADAAGYSRLMADDETATIAALDAARAVFREHIEGEAGRVVDTAGDSVLAVFETTAGAVRAAVAIQERLAELNAAEPEARRMRFRIGVHLGDIHEKADGTVYGDGINVAARLQALGEPGAVVVSDAVQATLRGRIAHAFSDLGEHAVKNIAEPVRAFCVGLTSPAGKMQRPLVLPDKPSIAVLPFENMSGDPEQGYFADGIADDLITALSRIRWLFVTARNSTFAYKGHSPDVRKVGHELAVRYVLEGSVRRGGDRVRVTAQLIDAASGNHVWAQRYDRELADIFAVQDEITANVTRAIVPELTQVEIARAARKRTDNLDAWDLYLQALPPFHRITKHDNEIAEEKFRMALELDPGFANARAFLAFAYVSDAIFGWSRSRRASMDQAKRCAEEAFAMDPTDPMANNALAWVWGFRDEPEQSLEAATRAYEYDPNSTFTNANFAGALVWNGRHEDALAVIRKAESGSERDPWRWLLVAHIGEARFCLGDYEASIDASRLSAKLMPQFYSSRLFWAAAAAFLGRMDEARQAVADALQLVPRLRIAAIRRHRVLAREADVKKLIEGLQKAGLPEE